MFFNTMSRIHCKLQGFWYGGGDPEVSPLGSAAGAARHYNLRLSTEGLRQGHGPPGPWAGARRPIGSAAWAHVGPLLASSYRLGVCGPGSALCWPCRVTSVCLGPSRPYVGQTVCRNTYKAETPLRRIFSTSVVL